MKAEPISVKEAWQFEAFRKFLRRSGEPDGLEAAFDSFPVELQQAIVREYQMRLAHPGLYLFCRRVIAAV